MFEQLIRKEKLVRENGKAGLYMCECVSATIEIEVAENRLHHGLVEPLQRLPTQRQICHPVTY